MYTNFSFVLVSKTADEELQTDDTKQLRSKSGISEVTSLTILK